MDALTKIYPGFLVYFTAVAFLHVAWKLSTHGLNDELMDILTTLLGQTVDGRHRHSRNLTSLLSLSQSAKTMKVVANKSRSTMSLIETELSKAYLHRALRCKDRDSDSIYCLANVYLAVLYYTTGHYHTAIDHCTLVVRSRDHSQCRCHVVHGELLPKVDDNIDNVLGLAVFYQHVRTIALNQQCSTQHGNILTTKLFAYYLSLTVSLNFSHTLSSDEVKKYTISVSDSEQLFIGDVLLFVSSLSQFSQQKCDYKSLCLQSSRQIVNPSKNSTSDLVELLEKSAVEHCTSFRHIEARDIGSVATVIVTTDFEALYAYKCGDYQRCLQLSTQNLCTLWYAVRMSDIPTFPEFIQLLDDDIVSLTALTLIVNPKCRRRRFSTCITQLTLSLYLMTQCQLKLHHSVTSLARTLDYIEDAQKILPYNACMDQLTLKLTKRKVVAYISALVLNNV